MLNVTRSSEMSQTLFAVLAKETVKILMTFLFICFILFSMMINYSALGLICILKSCVKMYIAFVYHQRICHQKPTCLPQCNIIGLIVIGLFWQFVTKKRTFLPQCHIIRLIGLFWQIVTKKEPFCHSATLSGCFDNSSPKTNAAVPHYRVNIRKCCLICSIGSRKAIIWTS